MTNHIQLWWFKNISYISRSSNNNLYTYSNDPPIDIDYTSIRLAKPSCRHSLDIDLAFLDRYPIDVDRSVFAIWVPHGCSTSFLVTGLECLPGVAVRYIRTIFFLGTLRVSTATRPRHSSTRGSGGAFSVTPITVWASSAAAILTRARKNTGWGNHRRAFPLHIARMADYRKYRNPTAHSHTEVFISLFFSDQVRRASMY